MKTLGLCLLLLALFVSTVAAQDTNGCSLDCGQFANCTASDGVETCNCNAGYTGNGTNCKDINECDNDPCDEYASCTNGNGTFFCYCRPGFSGDGITCEDINECLQGYCSGNATCFNNNGSFSCQCNEGFTGNPYGANCEAIGSGSCPSCGLYERCDGNECVCQTGFTGGVGNCSDINECESGYCDYLANSVCYNTLGSVRCDCKPGYYMNYDINNCTYNACYNYSCSGNATCYRNGSSAYCQCNYGYTGDGRNCTEIECPTCGQNERCDRGTGECVCDYGLTGSVGNCYDIDECELNYCDYIEGSICNNTIGSYDCTCEPGYYRSYATSQCIDEDDTVRRYKPTIITDRSDCDPFYTMRQRNDIRNQVYYILSERNSTLNGK